MLQDPTQPGAQDPAARPKFKKAAPNLNTPDAPQQDWDNIPNSELARMFAGLFQDTEHEDAFRAITEDAASMYEGLAGEEALLDSERRAYEREAQTLTPPGFFEGMTEGAMGRERSGPGLALPFWSTIEDADYAYSIIQAARARKDGTATEEQEGLLLDYGAWVEQQKWTDIEGATGQVAGKIFGEASAFLPEFWAGGKIWTSLAKKGVTKKAMAEASEVIGKGVAASQAAKAAGKEALESTATSTVKRLQDLGVLGVIGKTFTEGGKQFATQNLVGEVLGALTDGGGRARLNAYTNYLQANVGLEYNDALELTATINDDPESWLPSVIAGSLSAYIEMWSEASGVAMSEIGRRIAVAVPAVKMLQLQNVANRIGMPAAAQRLTKFGWSGILPETGEEALGAAAESALGATGLPGAEKLAGAWTEFTDPDQLLGTMLGIAAVGGAARAVPITVDLALSRGQYEAQQAWRIAFDLPPTPPPQLVSAVRLIATRQAYADAIAAGATEEQAQAQASEAADAELATLQEQWSQDPEGVMDAAEEFASNARTRIGDDTFTPEELEDLTASLTEGRAWASLASASLRLTDGRPGFSSISEEELSQRQAEAQEWVPKQQSKDPASPTLELVPESEQTEQQRSIAKLGAQMHTTVVVAKEGTQNVPARWIQETNEEGKPTGRTAVVISQDLSRPTLSERRSGEDVPEWDSLSIQEQEALTARRMFEYLLHEVVHQTEQRYRDAHGITDPNAASPFVTEWLQFLNTHAPDMLNAARRQYALEEESQGMTRGDLTPEQQAARLNEESLSVTVQTMLPFFRAMAEANNIGVFEDLVGARRNLAEKALDALIGGTNKLTSWAGLGLDIDPTRIRRARALLSEAKGVPNWSFSRSSIDTLSNAAQGLMHAFLMPAVPPKAQPKKKAKPTKEAKPERPAPATRQEIIRRLKELGVEEPKGRTKKLRQQLEELEAGGKLGKLEEKLDFLDDDADQPSKAKRGPAPEPTETEESKPTRAAETEEAEPAPEDPASDPLQRPFADLSKLKYELTPGGSVVATQLKATPLLPEGEPLTRLVALLERHGQTLDNKVGGKGEYSDLTWRQVIAQADRASADTTKNAWKAQVHYIKTLELLAENVSGVKERKRAPHWRSVARAFVYAVHLDQTGTLPDFQTRAAKAATTKKEKREKRQRRRASRAQPEIGMTPGAPRERQFATGKARKEAEAKEAERQTEAQRKAEREELQELVQYSPFADTSKRKAESRRKKIDRVNRLKYKKLRDIINKRNKWLKSRGEPAISVRGNAAQLRKNLLDSYGLGIKRPFTVTAESFEAQYDPTAEASLPSANELLRADPNTLADLAMFYWGITEEAAWATVGGERSGSKVPRQQRYLKAILEQQASDSAVESLLEGAEPQPSTTEVGEVSYGSTDGVGRSEITPASVRPTITNRWLAKTVDPALQADNGEVYVFFAEGDYDSAGWYSSRPDGGRPERINELVEVHMAAQKANAERAAALAEALPDDADAQQNAQRALGAYVEAQQRFQEVPDRSADADAEGRVPRPRALLVEPGKVVKMRTNQEVDQETLDKARERGFDAVLVESPDASESVLDSSPVRVYLFDPALSVGSETLGEESAGEEPDSFTSFRNALESTLPFSGGTPHTYGMTYIRTLDVLSALSKKTPVIRGDREKAWAQLRKRMDRMGEPLSEGEIAQLRVQEVATQVAYKKGEGINLRELVQALEDDAIFTLAHYAPPEEYEDYRPRLSNLYEPDRGEHINLVLESGRMYAEEQHGEGPFHIDRFMRRAAERFRVLAPPADDIFSRAYVVNTVTGERDVSYPTEEEAIAARDRMIAEEAEKMRQRAIQQREPGGLDIRFGNIDGESHFSRVLVGDIIKSTGEKNLQRRAMGNLRLDPETGDMVEVKSVDLQSALLGHVRAMGIDVDGEPVLYLYEVQPDMAQTLGRLMAPGAPLHPDSPDSIRDYNMEGMTERQIGRIEQLYDMAMGVATARGMSLPELRQAYRRSLNRHGIIDKDGNPDKNAYRRLLLRAALQAAADNNFSKVALPGNKETQGHAASGTQAVGAWHEQLYLKTLPKQLRRVLSEYYGPMGLPAESESYPGRQGEPVKKLASPYVGAGLIRGQSKVQEWADNLDIAPWVVDVYDIPPVIIEGSATHSRNALAGTLAEVNIARSVAGKKPLHASDERFALYSTGAETGATPRDEMERMHGKVAAAALDLYLQQTNEAVYMTDRRAKVHEDKLFGIASDMGLTGRAAIDQIRKWEMAMLLNIDLQNAELTTGKSAEEMYNEYSDKLTAEQRASYKLSQNLPGAVQELTETIIQQNDAMGNLALREGIIEGKNEVYSPRLWFREQGNVYTGLISPVEAGGHLKTKPGGREKRRVFESILHGWATPQDGGGNFRLSVPSATEAQRIVSRQVAEAVYNKRLLAVLKSSGALHKPQEGTPLPAEWASLKAPQLMGYAAPRELAKVINAITSRIDYESLPSVVRGLMRLNSVAKQTLLTFSYFHHQAFVRSFLFTIPGRDVIPESRGLLGLGAGAIKSAGYALGLTGRESVEGSAAKMRGYAAGRDAILENSDELVELVRAGLTVMSRQELDTLAETDVADWTAKGQKVMGVGHVKGAWDNFRRVQNQATRWLFNNMGAHLKTQAALLEYRHLLEKHAAKIASGQIKRREVARWAAEKVNADFGGLNLRMPTGKAIKGPRGAVAQAWMRALFLAPDWTESNFITAKNMFLRGEEGDVYRAMWANVMLRAGLTTFAWNLLMSGLDWDQFEENTTLAMQAGTGDVPSGLRKLYWMDANMNPLASMLNKYFGEKGAQAGSEKYFSILGHFGDPIKWALNFIPGAQVGKADILKPIKNKSSFLARTAMQAITGTDWAGRSYTTLGELVGVDLGQGTPDPERLGRLTDFRPYGERGLLAPDQVPSFALERISAMAPLQIEALYGFFQGQYDTFDTLGRMLGMKTHRTFPEK